MKNKIQKKILDAANILESFVGIVLIITIAIAIISLIVEVKGIIFSNNTLEFFNEFLESALNLVVGIEFVKMLCKHTPETVIEVLVFAIARQLIVGHTSILDTLIGVLAIAILFLINRFVGNNKEKIDK